MKKESLKRRAQKVARWLITGNADKLSSRAYDNCFEMGDGLQMVKALLKELASQGVTAYEQLPYDGRWYACRDWWTDPKYREPEPALGGLAAEMGYKDQPGTEKSSDLVIGQRIGAIYRHFLRDGKIFSVWLPRVQANRIMCCIRDGAFASGVAEFLEKKDALAYARKTRNEMISRLGGVAI